MQTFNITLDQALQVSDHLPVWAVFSCYENVSGEALVAQQGGTQRKPGQPCFLGGTNHVHTTDPLASSSL